MEMKVEMKKNKFRIVIELLIMFFLSLLVNLLNTPLNMDEIWNYGFAYNIATGLIPYKDFNMVVTPLFPLLGSIFLVIFGKNFLVYHIFGTLVCTIIYYLMDKVISIGKYIAFALLLFVALPNYSLFCVLLLYLLMLMEDKKSNDYLIGVVLGLTFLTKQNIGVMLCIPTLFTKDIKKILKRIIGFLIPNIIFVIYLLKSNTLFEFIDYCFLGLSSFAKENYVIKYQYLTIISIICLINKYRKNKDIKIIYILFFQTLAYPIFDVYHTFIPLVPTIGYFVNEIKIVKFKEEHINKFIKTLPKIFFCTFEIFILINCIITIYNKKSTSNIELFPNEIDIFKYRALDIYVTKDLNIVSEYLKDHKEEKVYIIDMDAYLYKLEAKLQLTKYDLLNDGNLGKNGAHKIIQDFEQICSKNKCIYLINEKKIFTDRVQTNDEIVKYVINNYNKTGNISIFSIYESEVQNEK